MIGLDEYVTGEIQPGWPDGTWPIKLPNATLETIETRSGKTSGLALFIWNALTPGAELTLHPPHAASPGVVTVDRAGPVQTTRKPVRRALLPPERDAPEEALSVALRRAVDRLQAPTSLEHVWAMLSDRGIDLPASEVIRLLRDQFHVDDFGFVRTYDDPDLEDNSFRPDDCKWDNIEHAYWELDRSGEPPPLERMYRKRKSSIHDGMEYHLDDIRHDLLSAQKEARLGAAIHAGQEAEAELHEGEADHERKVELGMAIRAADEAREEFLKHNLRLVFNNAIKYERKVTNSALGVSDLVQAGYEGLLKAVERFDPTKGFKFSTYATWWIRQTITRHIADHGRTIRLPVHVYDKAQLVNRTADSLLSTTGRSPTTNQIAEETGLSQSDVVTVLELHSIESLDQADQASDLSIEESTVRELTEASIREVVDETFRGYDPRLAAVVISRFGLDGSRPLTLEEVGRRFNVTRERIRQLESKALGMIRANPDLHKAISDWIPLASPRPVGQEKTPTDGQQAAWARVRARAKVIEALYRE